MKGSKLVRYSRRSPNYSSRNENKITKLTPHHMAGQLSLKSLGNLFAKRSTGSSSHYGISNDGVIGQYVDERYRPWTSSSYSNDSQAITCEIANSTFSPTWKVSKYALEAYIVLAVDIAQRYNFKNCNYTGKASGTLTKHKMFASTSCPGAYLDRKMEYIEKEVESRIKSRKYRVQVGSFRSVKNAMARKDNLEKQGFACTIIPYGSKFGIRAREFNNESLAKEHRDKIKQVTGLKAYVIKQKRGG